jgi:hypothetical protein
MELVKFQSQLGGKDPAASPFKIAARDLDGNFAKLKPLQADGDARQYLLTETPEGWSLKIFPQFPTGGLHILGVENGSLRWVPTTGCD